MRRSSSSRYCIFSMRQRIVCLHRRVAGDRRGEVLDRDLDRRAAIAAVEVVGERADRRRRGFDLHDRRHRRDVDGAIAERLDLEAEARQVLAARAERFDLGRRQLEDERRQQALALEGARREALEDLLVEDALVGDVLIDDQQALAVDGDDERVAQLAERHHRPHRIDDAPAIDEARRRLLAGRQPRLAMSPPATPAPSGACVHGSVPGSATVIATASPSRASSAPAPSGSPKTPGSDARRSGWLRRPPGRAGAAPAPPAPARNRRAAGWARPASPARRSAPAAGPRAPAPARGTAPRPWSGAR